MSNKEYFNYGEALCDAVDIILSEKLKGLEHDITKVCTIVDDTYKKLGKYTVKDDSIKYDAYSIETNYNIDDQVFVIIPNGDYSMQKHIISKVVSENDLTTSALYESPLSTMLDFTGNILNGKTNVDGNLGTEFSLLANHPTNNMKLLYRLDNWGTMYQDYAMMSISADFQTWLSEFDVQQGTYGLKFLFFKQGASVNDIQTQNAPYVFTFNTNDILGNPYNFESYFTQEKVIDISYLNNIGTVDIYFYQDMDFKDYSNNLIPYKFEEDEEFLDGYTQELSDNLFINNLKIYLGYPINSFSGDTLKLSVDDIYYSSIIDKDKNMTLRWIHQLDENKYELLNESSQCELYWVRDGETQQTISNIVGQYWNEQNINVNISNPFEAVLDMKNENYDLRANIENRIKVVGRIKKDDGNWAQYESNVVTLISTDERINQATLDATTDLVISCADNTEGIYLMYNQNSEIINEGQGQGYPRKFEIIYKNSPLGASSIKDDIAKVKWTLPINAKNNESYTMLQYKGSDLNKTDAELEALENNTFIREIFAGEGNYNQSYSISNNWYISNSHNIVSCEVQTKTGQIYKATKELIFGKANSQGSNLSLIIQYKDNKNAYEVISDDEGNIQKRKSVILKSLAYDLSGKKLDPSTGTWSWKLYPSNNTTFKFINEAKTDTAEIILQDTVKKVSDIGYNIIEVQYQESGSNRVIKAQYPIAVKTLDTKEQSRCQSFEGARSIIYDSQGVPSYYTDIYQLINSSGTPISGISWSISPNNKTNYDPTLKNIKRKEKQSNNKEVTITYKALLAKTVYVSNHNYASYVTAKKGDIIYWIQPILITQSQYDFAITNDWNGTTNIQDNSIVSAVIAAGKKDPKTEAFSGILMGDVNQQQGNSTIGLYGISNGDVTFSLTENGLATFGYDKTNKALEVLLGTDNQILSHGAAVLKDGKEAGHKNSLLFDIDSGLLEFQSDSSLGGGLFLSTGSPYLKFVDNATEKNMLLFNTSNFYIQSPDYSDTTGLRLNIKNGTITVNKGAVKLTNGNNYIGTTDNGTNLLKLGKLKVDKDGEVYYGSKTLSAYISDAIAAANKT